MTVGNVNKTDNRKDDVDNSQKKKRKNISKMLVTIPNTSRAKQTKVFGTEEPGNTETRPEVYSSATVKLE